MRARSRLPALNLFPARLAPPPPCRGGIHHPVCCIRPPPPPPPGSARSQNPLRPPSVAVIFILIVSFNGNGESRFWKFLIRFDNLIYKLDSTLN